MAGSTRAPLIDVESDYGLYVRAAIESPALGAGSEVLSGRWISVDELIDELIAALAEGAQFFVSRSQHAFAELFIL
jgi:hypothetical protein